MKNKQKGYVVPILVVVAVLVIGSGIYLYSQNKVENDMQHVVSQNTAGNSQANQTNTSSNDRSPVLSSVTPSTVSAGAALTLYGSGFLHTPPGGTMPQNQNGIGVVLKNSSGQQVTLWPTVWNMEVKENSIVLNLPASVCLQVERGCGSSDPASYYMKIIPGNYSVALVIPQTGVTSNTVSFTVK